MRLVDADKIIDKLKEYTRSNNGEFNGACRSIIEVIEQQPTAFDVDKVEKELEEKVENSNLNIQIICFSQALDIFKGGKNE